MTTSFRRGVEEVAAGKVLAPVIRGELMSPRFRGFTIKVEKFTPRPPDGWFHPSTHADWPARKLALYLRHPELIEDEPPTLEMVLAVTQGHFWHKLGGKILMRNGILLGTELECKDPEHNRKGHMDGFLATNEGWEFKTVNNEYLLKKIEDVETLRQYKPGYYAQAQDYLDMRQLSAMRFLLMGMFYPYPMVEFPIPYDEKFQLEQRAKYREALERAQTGAGLPDPCCLPRSAEAKACEMKLACPVGRAALGLTR